MFRFFRMIAVLALIALASVFALGQIVLEPAPAVEEMAAPTPEDVKATRDFYHEVRSASNGPPGGVETVVLPISDLQSTMRLGARFLPGFRAAARIEGDLVIGEAAVPVPWIGGTRWLNVQASVPSFNERLAFGAVRLGGREISPGFALVAGRIGANILLGNRAGDTILDSASAMAIDGSDLVFALRLDDAGRGEVAQGIFGALRDGAMPSPEQIDRYYVQIREALDDGRLPSQGSYLPHIVFALEAALTDATAESLPNDFTAAMFGLARACGARDFTLLVGRLAGVEDAESRVWRQDCSRLTLNGRIDSRRHFTTAAAIQAASNRGFSGSIGEFKELHDSLAGGSGFDFTDLAANASGIRLADLFMATDIDLWPAVIARIKSERDIIPSFDDVPAAMSRADFTARFGTIESPAYLRELDLIERKIDGLALYAD